MSPQPAYDPALWLDAVFLRRSRRSFVGAASHEALQRLHEVAEDFAPFDDARVIVIDDAPESLFTGWIGSYGRVIGARSALAFVITADSPTCEEHCGYTGEGLVLEAQSLGLGTCWIGGSFSRASSRRILALRPGEEVRAVSPIGNPAPVSSSAERFLYGRERPKHRRTLGEIAAGHEAWPDWAVRGVEAARIAPSAVNRQPWRFRYEDGAVLVGSAPAMTGFRRLDCGIAMLHFELGARAAGTDGVWEPLADPDVARWVPLD